MQDDLEYGGVLHNILGVIPVGRGSIQASSFLLYSFC